MKLLFLLSLSLTATYSFHPEMALYTGYDTTGNGLIVRSKEASVLNLSPTIVSTYKSACFTGFWLSYNSENYFAYTVALGHWSSTPYCHNSSSFGIQMRSARYLGTSDSETPSISFYSQPFWQSVELTVQESAYANLPFVPSSLFASGGANWTLYTGTNFDGKATCFVATNVYNTMSNMNSSINSIHSVRKDCNGRIDEYVFPKPESFVIDVERN